MKEHKHVFDIPTGPSPVTGKCRLCSATREFTNYSDGGWGARRFRATSASARNIEDTLASPLNSWPGEGVDRE